MNRVIACLALLSSAAPAQAGGYLGGGFLGSPTKTVQLATGLPTFRVGVGSPRLVGFASLQFARVTVKRPELKLWGAQPMIGMRARLGEPDDMRVSPVATLGTYTRIWGVKTDENPEDFEPDQNAGLRPVVGGIVGAGLDAQVTDNLSLSVEFGLDVFTGGYQFDGWVSHLDTFTTWSAVNVHIWL